MAAKSRGSLFATPSGEFSKATTGGLWVPERIAEAGTNLARAYEAAPEQAHEWGRQFYPEWQQTAAHIGAMAGQSTAHGAAILAHLSPQNEAEINRIQAMGMVHGGGGIESTRQTNAMMRAGLAGEAAKSHEASLRAGKQKLAEGKVPRSEQSAHMKQMQYHQEEYERHSAENQRLRRMAGVVGTPLGWLSSQRLAQATAVREGTSLENFAANQRNPAAADPLSTLGGVKISDFGRMMTNPEEYERPPIDTHYHDAAIGRRDIPYEGERGLDAPGRYESFQRAHQFGYGVADPGIPHSAFMGSVWYAHQIAKAMEFPGTSGRSRRSAASKLRNVRQNPRFQHWMPENYGLPPAFAKVGV